MFFSNRGETTQTLNPGVHGLSNGLLNEPWPKVVSVRDQTMRLLGGTSLDLEQGLFELLRNSTQPPDEALPDTGVGIDIERAMGPVFVNVPEKSYGTRSSTVLLVGKDHTVQLIELTHLGEKTFSRVRHTFRLNDPSSLKIERE